MVGSDGVTSSRQDCTSYFVFAEINDLQHTLSFEAWTAPCVVRVKNESCHFCDLKLHRQQRERQR